MTYFCPIVQWDRRRVDWQPAREVGVCFWRWYGRQVPTWLGNRAEASFWNGTEGGGSERCCPQCLLLSVCDGRQDIAKSRYETPGMVLSEKICRVPLLPAKAVGEPGGGQEMSLVDAASGEIGTPRHQKPRHSTPSHATPRNATKNHGTPLRVTPRHAMSPETRRCTSVQNSLML